MSSSSTFPPLKTALALWPCLQQALPWESRAAPSGCLGLRCISPGAEKVHFSQLNLSKSGSQVSCPWRSNSSPPPYPSQKESSKCPLHTGPIKSRTLSLTLPYLMLVHP